MPGNIGTYVFDKTSLDSEDGIELGPDLSRCRQVVAGATISSATVRVLLSNAASSHFTLSSSSATIASDSKSASVRVTDAAAVVGNSYRLVFRLTLSDTTVLVRWITLNVEGP